MAKKLPDIHIEALHVLLRETLLKKGSPSKVTFLSGEKTISN